MIEHIKQTTNFDPRFDNRFGHLRNSFTFLDCSSFIIQIPYNNLVTQSCNRYHFIFFPQLSLNQIINITVLRMCIVFVSKFNQAFEIFNKCAYLWNYYFSFQNLFNEYSITPQL